MSGHDLEDQNINAAGGVAGSVFLLLHIPFVLILFLFICSLLLAIF